MLRHICYSPLNVVPLPHSTKDVPPAHTKPVWLGMKWHKIADDDSLTIYLSQEATISALVDELGLEDANIVHSP